MWKLKVVNDNDYIATVLVGEGVIGAKKNIIKYSGNNVKMDPVYSSTNETSESRIKEIITETLRSRDAEFLELKTKVNSNTESIGEVKSQMAEMGNKMDEMGNKMDNNFLQVSKQINDLDGKLIVHIDKSIQGGMEKIDGNIGNTLSKHLNAFMTNLQGKNTSVSNEKSLIPTIQSKNAVVLQGKTAQAASKTTDQQQ